MSKRLPPNIGLEVNKPLLAEKEKRSLYNRQWKQNNPDKVKASYRKWCGENGARRKEINIEAQLRRYGLTRLDYDQMVDSQHGLCAVCARPETAKRRGKTRALCVDHDHLTSKVRGLLCSSCNRALGYLGDDLLRIRALAVYLESCNV